jgi:hypothetical protein
MRITILQVTYRVMTVWRWRWPCQRCPCPETQLVVCPAGRAARRSVAECRGIPRPTTSQPLREQEQIRAAQRPSQGVSNSGELPARQDLRERISGTQQPTGVTGELFSTAFRWSSAWHSRDTARISNHYVHTLSKIDPQSEQLDGVEL